MRRALSLAAAFLVTFSLSGCAARNNAGPGVRRLSYENNINTTNVRYRDGIYTGYGNAHGNSNEMAIVEIRNGKIANIRLSNVNLKKGTTNTPATGTSVPRGTNTAIINQGGTNIGTGFGNTMTPGTTTGTRTSYPINTNVGVTNGTAPGTGIRNTTGVVTVPGTGTTTGTTTGINNATGTGAGTLGSTVVNTLDRVRTDLSNMMVRFQRHDVNYINNNAALSGSVSNWKLAVSRALAKAKV